MNAWWRLRRATAEAAPLLIPGDYRLTGDTASRLPDYKAFGRLPNPRRMRVVAGSSGTPEHDTLIRRSLVLTK